ncbi:MAG TPA: RluA family pseudouridine synthase [Candidatus Polarisedimenticolia bacterium]|nr:RluA family pseudouridine synthase [Candidatus Polarisedimenticolia bacterium]
MLQIRRRRRKVARAAGFRAVKEVQSDVAAHEAGRTLASFVKSHAAVSHASAKGIIEAGGAQVNGRCVRDPVHRLSQGDRVAARFDEATRYKPSPRPRDGAGFRVLVQDERLLVADKEAGLLTVPAPGHSGDTLVDRLAAREARRGVRAPRLWIVHRIDRYTSGLVLFARDEEAAGALITQFRRRSAAREYLALCEGAPRPEEGRLRSRLLEDPRSLKVYEARPGAGGQLAVCSYRTEEVFPDAALLRVRLETGRRNQIRVQLAGIGHPVLGDRTYGRPSPLLARAALHAARLGFLHPASGAQVRVESPLPPDMRRALRRLRAGRRGGAPS